jgi:hypothetical protein
MMALVCSRALGWGVRQGVACQQQLPGKRPWGWRARRVVWADRRLARCNRVYRHLLCSTRRRVRARCLPLAAGRTQALPCCHDGWLTCRGTRGVQVRRGCRLR